MANIILNDGHFAKERERESQREGDEEGGSCTLLYGGHRGKLQSSVTHLEYLTHCERHYFSLISRVFLGFHCHDRFDRNRQGPCINLASETREKAAPF